eukprot:scpid67875/ scgid3180/ 
MYLTGTCHVPVGTGDDEENAENSGTLSRRVSSDTEQAGTPTPPVAHGSESNHVDGEQPPPQDQFAERLQPTQEQREQQGQRQLEQHFQRSAERHDPRPEEQHDPRPEEQHDPRPEEQHDPRPEEQHSPRSAEQHNHSAEQQHDPRSAGQHNHSAEQQHNPRPDDQQVERHHTLQRQLSFVMTAGLFRYWAGKIFCEQFLGRVFLRDCIVFRSDHQSIIWPKHFLCQRTVVEVTAEGTLQTLQCSIPEENHKAYRIVRDVGTLVDGTWDNLPPTLDENSNSKMATSIGQYRRAGFTRTFRLRMRVTAEHTPGTRVFKLKPSFLGLEEIDEQNRRCPKCTIL